MIKTVFELLLWLKKLAMPYLSNGTIQAFCYNYSKIGIDISFHLAP